MQEAILTYQCGNQIKEVGLNCTNEDYLLEEIEDDSINFINLQMIGDKKLILSKNTII